MRLRELFKNTSSPSACSHLHQFLDSSQLCELWNARWSQSALKNVQFASIGPVTSCTLRELQLPVSIEAREFTMGGLIRAIILARYAQPPNSEQRLAK